MVNRGSARSRVSSFRGPAGDRLPSSQRVRPEVHTRTSGSSVGDAQARDAHHRSLSQIPSSRMALASHPNRDHFRRSAVVGVAPQLTPVATHQPAVIFSRPDRWGHGASQDRIHAKLATTIARISGLFLKLNTVWVPSPSMTAVAGSAESGFPYRRTGTGVWSLATFTNGNTARTRTQCQSATPAMWRPRLQPRRSGASRNAASRAPPRGQAAVGAT